MISFLVTGRCQLRCAHCFLSDEGAVPTEELSLEAHERIAAGLGRFLVGLFCGGEPFLRDDLAEIVAAYRRSSGMPLACVSTNGQRTGAVVAGSERIASSRPRGTLVLSLSLDGPREVHDAIRGAGSFDRAIRTWREIGVLARHRRSLVPVLTTVVSTLSQHSAPAFLAWAGRELRPAAMNVILVRQSPRAGPHIKGVDTLRYLEAQRAVAAARPSRGLPGRLDPIARCQRALAEGVAATMRTGRRSFRCLAGHGGAVVNSRGDVDVCEVLAERAEAIPRCRLDDWDLDFGALWNSAAMDGRRALVGRHEACRDCTHETMGYLPALLSPRGALPLLLRRGGRGASSPLSGGTP